MLLSSLVSCLLVISVSGDCISMSELEVNMPQWVGLVPYSHLRNKTWGYPTDCSGFVSWALQAFRNLKSYEYGSSVYSTRIDTDELQYGDVITHVSCDDDIADVLMMEEMDLEASGYISGHVFFFDRWDDDEHNNFWAYESTQTQDQTEACLEQTNPVTRSECLNHYVLKSRDVPEKWSKNNCSSSKYGYVTGGPQRLSEELLCRDNDKKE